MFGLFDKKKEAEVSLADRIAANRWRQQLQRRGRPSQSRVCRSRDSAASVQAI